MKKTTLFYIKSSILILGTVVLTIAMIHQWGKKELPEKSNPVFSEQYVTAEEIPSLLSFVYHTKEEWQEKFKGQLSKKITYQDLSFIIKSLGLTNHVTYSKEKKEMLVTRGVFNHVYEQVLELLDSSHTVTKSQTKFLKITQGANGHVVVMTTDDFFELELKEGFVQENQIYGIYSYQGKIIGVNCHMIDDIIGENHYKEQTLPCKNKIIRVVIKNQTSVYRRKVYITADTDFYITNHGDVKKYQKGTIVSVGKLNLKKDGDYIIAKNKSKSNDFFLTNEKGEKISKGYRGTFYIYRYKEGYVVVNHLGIEDYLCGVVTSEMPECFHIEALKAQAVCARSYVYSQITAGDYANLKAHIDDSTRYQAYNIQNENQKSCEAIAATKGEVLTYNNKIATAYYFSTSCGVTSDYKFWELPKKKFGYLQEASLGRNKNLSKNKKFEEFIQRRANAYDQDAPYYRWKGVWKPNTYRFVIKAAIAERKLAAPDTVEIHWNKKENATADLSSIGNFVGIKNIKREKSGGIHSLTLVYENGKVELKSEYTIRFVIGTGVPTVTLKNHTKQASSLLPSAYCMFRKKQDGSYEIRGGGFGHGIGMSQYGADQMGKEGFSYKEILHFYYDGVKLEQYEE
ncbi:MAG: SpoIID/LytB domain-containing protein [Lachnospiraceae bacterium]